MNIVRTAAPTTWALDIPTVQAHLRLADTTQNSYLQLLIQRAQNAVENRIGIAITEQEWRLSLDEFPGINDVRILPAYPTMYGFPQVYGFPMDFGFAQPRTIAGPSSGRIELPRPPLIEIEDITYVDQNGIATELDASLYQVDADGWPARLFPPAVGNWPSVQQGVANGLQITYTCGFADPTLIPDVVPQAMLLLIGYWYENREGGAEDDMAIVDLLCGSLRVWSEYRQ
jgi:hypothetical protein